MTLAVNDRESEFLQRLADGETTREIADAWNMAQTSIWTVAERLRKKLGAKTNEHAVLLACRAGILDGRPRSQRHGDHAGYTQHQKRGEEACGPCKAGERAYQVERRRRRQNGLSGPVAGQEAPGGGLVVQDAARAADGLSAPRREAERHRTAVDGPAAA